MGDFDYTVVRGGTAGMRDCHPALGASGSPSAASRGGSCTASAINGKSGGAVQIVELPKRLGGSNHSAMRYRRRGTCVAARRSPRWIQWHQRIGPFARPPHELRQLGSSGCQRVELSRAFAVSAMKRKRLRARSAGARPRRAHGHPSATRTGSVITGVAGHRVSSRPPDERRQQRSGQRGGASWTETNVVEGRRQSAAVAYLRRVLRRPKRSVVTDAHVTRLEFDAVVAEPNTNPVLQCASSSRTVA